jgi:hypothetical protein
MYSLLVQFNIETATEIFVFVTSTTLKGLERGEGRSNKLTLRRRKKSWTEHKNLLSSKVLSMEKV